MIADGLTKPLARMKFNEFKRKLRLVDLSQDERLEEFSLRRSVRKQPDSIFGKNRGHGSWATDLIPRAIPIRTSVVGLR